MTVHSPVFLIPKDSWFTEYPKTSPVKCCNKLDICVVYSLWDKTEYAQCLYWSLLSQKKFTDIEAADVKIFVSESIYEFTKKLLAPFGVDIIKMREWFCSYTILDHSSLTPYKYIVNIDTDVFFLGKKVNLYQAISDLNIESVGMIPKMWLHSDVKPQLKLKRDLDQTDASMSEYLKRFAKSLGISNKELARRIDNVSWCYGYFYVCNRKFFQGKSWNGLVQYSKKIKNSSDETVLLLYSHEHIVDINPLLLNRDIKLSAGWTSIEMLRDEATFLNIVHPSEQLYADKRVIFRIVEEISDFQEPKLITKKHAAYCCPLHSGQIDGAKGGRFTELPASSDIRVVCLGCSFTNLRYGWPYFLSQLLPEGYEVVDLGFPGAGLNMFEQIVDLLNSYEPKFIACQSMSSTRVLDDVNKFESLVEVLCDSGATIERRSSIKLTCWLMMRANKGVGEVHDEISRISRFKTLFKCPVIFMGNKYDFPIYPQASKIWNLLDIITFFKGIEYSTYSLSRRDEVWHPSVKRSKEEAELMAKLLLSQTREPHSQIQE